MRSEQELRELLPWYVNNTLDASTRRDVDALVERSPLVRGEVIWLRTVRSQIRQARVQADRRSPSAGLDTLMALICGEGSGKVLPLRVRLNAWLALPRRFSLPVGLAAVVVLTQAAVIATLLGRPSQEQLNPYSGGVAMDGQLLQVTFKPQTTEAQIRGLLANLQAEIVSGPGALGVYTVRVPEGQGASALAKLRGDRAVIESAALLAGR